MLNVRLPATATQRTPHKGESRFVGSQFGRECFFRFANLDISAIDYTLRAWLSVKISEDLFLFRSVFTLIEETPWRRLIKRTPRGGSGGAGSFLAAGRYRMASEPVGPHTNTLAGSHRDISCSWPSRGRSPSGVRDGYSPIPQPRGFWRRRWPVGRRSGWPPILPRPSRPA